MAASALSSGSPAVSPPPRAVLERPVFSIAGRIYRWQDVLDAGRHWGDLATLERQAAEGIAALDLAATAGRPLDEAEVEAKADAFRHEHKLLAAEEMEAWLARWELVYDDDWLAYCGRALARARLDGRLESSRSPPLRRIRAAWPTSSGRRRSAQGRLAEWAWKLAGQLASADGRGCLAGQRARPKSSRPPTSARGAR